LGRDFIQVRDSSELVDLAIRFIVEDRLASLDNDIFRCVPKAQDKRETTSNAPFPAILYCFSIIDLLGALSMGSARSGNTTNNSRQYILDLIKYPKDKVQLLLQIYRHKTVHLSQPKSTIFFKGKVLTWQHNENDPQKHLNIDPTSGDLDIYGNRKVHGDAIFIISIWKLKDDIRESVTRRSVGYIDRLRNDVKLQTNFKKAVNEIFDPKINPSRMCTPIY
jgi:hypothetical protein